MSAIPREILFRFVSGRKTQVHGFYTGESFVSRVILLIRSFYFLLVTSTSTSLGKLHLPMLITKVQLIGNKAVYPLSLQKLQKMYPH